MNGGGCHCYQCIPGVSCRVLPIKSDFNVKTNLGGAVLAKFASLTKNTMIMALLFLFHLFIENFQDKHFVVLATRSSGGMEGRRASDRTACLRNRREPLLAASRAVGASLYECVASAPPRTGILPFAFTV